MEVKPYQIRLPDPNASVPVLPSHAEKPASKSPRWYQEHPTFRYLAPDTKLSDNKGGKGKIWTVDTSTLGKVAETSGRNVRFTLKDANGKESSAWAMYGSKGGFEKSQDPQLPPDKPD